MSVSDVGASTPFIASTATRKVSGTAPLDASAADSKLDPAKFKASHKSVMNKVKSPVTANTLYAALQEIKQNKNHEATKVHIEANDGEGHSAELNADVKSNQGGLMIKGTVTGIPGLPKMHFSVAIKGNVAQGGQLKIDAKFHTSGTPKR
jgi:hypothetical protein